MAKPDQLKLETIDLTKPLPKGLDAEFDRARELLDWLQDEARFASQEGWYDTARSLEPAGQLLLKLVSERNKTIKERIAKTQQAKPNPPK